MYEIRKWVELDAGHRVPTTTSKCRHLHGHRYRVTAVVTADSVVPETSGRSDAGMVVDFGVVKQALLQEVHDPYDHQLILWENDPLVNDPNFFDGLDHHELWSPGVRLVPCIPTAEELARFWAPKVQEALYQLTPGVPHRHLFHLRALEVRETPTSYATFYPNGVSYP